MKRTSFYCLVGIGLFVLFVTIYGFSLIYDRPGLPLSINPQDVVQIDGINIENNNYLDIILSKKIPGDTIELHFVSEDGNIQAKKIQVVRYYSHTAYLYIYLLIGLFTFSLGIFVLFSRPNEPKARIYYLASLAFSLPIIINSGIYCLRNTWVSCLPGVLFYFLYPVAPALLFHFTLYFSKSWVIFKTWLLYVPALVLTLFLEFSFLLIYYPSSIEITNFYHYALHANRFYVLLATLLTLCHLIFIYKRTAFEQERAQIKWIFIGLFTGLGPFILLSLLPQLLGISPIISEQLYVIFFITVPIAFAFSIFKFRLINIDYAINRSLVYSILTILIVGIYLFIVYILQQLFSNFITNNNTTVSITGALICAALFHPVRRKLQDIIDRTFYRQNYDYRQAILSFTERSHHVTSPYLLIDLFLATTNQVIPLEHIDVSILSSRTNKRELFFERNRNRELSNIIADDIASGRILARRNASFTEGNIDYSHHEIIEANQLEIILPISFISSSLVGYLSLGSKRSGKRFTKKNIEFLVTMAKELSFNLEKLSLVQDIAYEKAQKEKLEELYHQKSEFISIISHELRTPMNSILGIAEILQQNKIHNKTKIKQLIDIIGRESCRLSRFLHNILEYSTNEQQEATYNLQEVTIQSLIKETVEFTRFAFCNDKFTLRTQFPDYPIILRVDRDAVKQALTNILDNAIKYSGEHRIIDISVIEKRNQIEIQVGDKGIGIPSEEQDKIFNAFYRVNQVNKPNISGIGLGLKIVKHIMRRHNGNIKVKSQQHAGTTISLCFPKP